MEVDRSDVEQEGFTLSPFMSPENFAGATVRFICNELDPRSAWVFGRQGVVSCMQGDQANAP